MDQHTALAALTDQPVIDSLAEPLSHAVHEVYDRAGAAGQAVKNAMHGVWLGHPLHPVLTDIPLGAWTTALALDLDASTRDDQGMRRAATAAMGVGLLGAMGAAVTGLTDWSETEGRSRREGLLHGLLNIAATALMTTAYVRRLSNGHTKGRACAWTGFAIALGAAFLGGDLVYGQRIGVTHAVAEEPEKATKVSTSAALPDGTMRRARHGDIDVLLVRQHKRVCALAHSCSHMGGPLSEGTLKDGSVVCPWHASEFDLSDGHVINGPATEPQAVFEVREHKGRIDIKAT